MSKSISELESLTDNALMLKVKDGDLDRLGLLFERYKKPLFGFFYGMNKDAELSEDLVQNVFFRVLKYTHCLSASPNFSAFLLVHHAYLHYQ